MLRRSIKSAWIVLISAALATAACSATKKTDKVEYPGLTNFHQVVAGIYRGAAPTDEGLKTLKSMKIHTIIDLRSYTQAKHEKETAERMGFEWLNLPMGKEAPTQKQVDKLLKTLAKADKEPVFVHCQHGADRTGCMIGIYRVKVQHWTFDDAWKEMRKYGFKWFLFDLKEAVRSRAGKTRACMDQPILESCSLLTSYFSGRPSQYA
jgi:protein tyrosine/serine phosphatase